MSENRQIAWASSALLWVWVIGLAIAAGAGVFVGTTTTNLMLGVTWGIALAVAWIVIFAVVRARRRGPGRSGHISDDEPADE